MARLAEGLARYRADESDDQIRDGLIQRFEFTYDLSHELLRRALEAAAANPEEVDRMSFPTLIRTAAEQGLVGSDWAQWRTWREMRNITSHTDDEAKKLPVSILAGCPPPLNTATEKARQPWSVGGGLICTAPCAWRRSTLGTTEAVQPNWHVAGPGRCRRP